MPGFDCFIDHYWNLDVNGFGALGFNVDAFFFWNVFDFDYLVFLGDYNRIP